jgi:hypothetical protein
LPAKLFWRDDANANIVDASFPALAVMPALSAAITDQRHIAPDGWLRLDESERLGDGGDGA